MGRKKAKKKATKNPDEQAIDILAQLLEDVGIFKEKGPGENCWESFAASIDILASKLEKYRSNMQNYNDIDDSIELVILETEEAVQFVRRDAVVIESEIQALDSRLQVCRDLELVSPHLLVLAKSLCGAICEQKWIAQDTLNNVMETVNHLYCDTEEHSTTKSTLTKSANLFRKRCIDAKQSPWKEALSILQDDSKPYARPPELIEEIIAFGFQPMCNKLQFQCNHLPTLNHHKTIFDAAKGFAFEWDISQPAFTSILLVGPEGSGKTQCCDEIERLAQPAMNVIRPTLPFDIMGKTIGATEDILISILSSSPEPSIVILDDIDTILGSKCFSFESPSDDTGGTVGSGQQAEAHVTTRLRALFLSLLDRSKTMSSASRTMLICTSVVDLGKSVGRFDKTYHLSTPDAQNRQIMILRCIGTLGGFSAAEAALRAASETKVLLKNIVECTAGLSYAELAQNCRQAMLASYRQHEASQHATSAEILFLKYLKEQVQISTPNSLRSGFNADSLDIRILSGKDLLEMSKSRHEYDDSFPLYGKSARDAWEDIRRTVVIPICQATALKNLIYSASGQGGRIFSGGVLLTGNPGCGKSALAYHAAMVASQLNPAVKLVDVSCTSLISKEVGSSERSVHRLFEAARTAAPCILVMDGIENVAAVRGNDNTTEGTMDRVLSTLLVELDGINGEQSSESNSAGFAVIGITSDSKWIDPALLRPGRLGHTIELGFPEYSARKEIASRELKGTECAANSSENGFKEVDSLSDFIASKTDGFSAAVIIAVCNEAKMLSSRTLKNDPKRIELRPQHILTAIEARRGASSQ